MLPVNEELREPTILYTKGTDTSVEVVRLWRALKLSESGELGFTLETTPTEAFAALVALVTWLSQAVKPKKQ